MKSNDSKAVSFSVSGFDLCDGVRWDSNEIFTPLSRVLSGNDVDDIFSHLSSKRVYIPTTLDGLKATAQQVLSRSLQLIEDYNPKTRHIERCLYTSSAVLCLCILDAVELWPIVEMTCKSSIFVDLNDEGLLNGVHVIFKAVEQIMGRDAIERAEDDDLQGEILFNFIGLK